MPSLRTPICKGRAGFTLAEVMIAILFISIAFFGYMSLHIRLMHSGQKLELRQQAREEVGQSLTQQVVAARSEGEAVGTPLPELPAVKRLSVSREWEDKNGAQNYLVETLATAESWQW